MLLWMRQVLSAPGLQSTLTTGLIRHDISTVTILTSFLFLLLKVFQVCVCLSNCKSFQKFQLLMRIYQFYILPAILNYRNTVVYLRVMKLSPTSNISLISLTNIFSVC